MIYTVTFNPSLDYIVRVDGFKPGIINRTTYENILPGGKGINVSIVLDIEELMKGFGCGVDLIRVREGFSRINVKLKSGEETEINGQGPLITAEDIEKLYEKLDSLVSGDILVISGSVPGSLPRDVYERITQRLEGKGVRIVVDAEKDLLIGTLRCRPWLVKPNERELGEIYRLLEDGARNVLISMAGEGAVFISENGEVFRSPAPKGVLVNSVGAGDSMVAGFISGYLETGDYREAFRMGIAAGSASAFSPNLATRPETEALLQAF